ncbi:DUF3558 family protein [Nocardia sp. NPDC050697]|uniref:DUF3558 family protein n=1 Tax=Nocardia sp. NPDC050697 TaxID=3155158 RepID=UPI00340D861D
MRKFGRGLVLGVVAPIMVVAGCATEERGAEGAPASSVAVTSSPRTPAPDSSAPGGVDSSDPNPAPGGEQPGNSAPIDGQPGGTDACGATPCGAPEARNQPTSTPLWDPCAIPDTAIAAQDYRPASKSTFGGPGAADLNCRWLSATGAVELTVVSVEQSITGFRQSGRYLDFAPLTIAGREAYRFRAAQDSNHIGCYAGFPVSGGTVAFVIRNLSAEGVEEPCVPATRLSTALAGYLP